MSVNQERVDISAEARAISKAIRSIIAKGKAAGFPTVGVFFEGEGAVFLMDESVPETGNETPGERQANIIGRGHRLMPSLSVAHGRIEPPSVDVQRDVANMIGERR